MAAMEAGPVPATLAPEDAARDASEAAGAGPEAPLLPAGNRLSLHLHPGGCHRLLRLCAQQAPQLLEVDFLQLSGHEDPQLLEAALARLPWSLPRLRSLVLKGERPQSQPWPSLSLAPASASWSRKVDPGPSPVPCTALPSCIPPRGSWLGLGSQTQQLHSGVSSRPQGGSFSRGGSPVGDGSQLR